MLAHMKGKRRSFSEDEEENNGAEENGSTADAAAARPHSVSHDDHTHSSSAGIPPDTTAMYADHDATQMTCDVLCSLSGAMAPSSGTVGSSDNDSYGVMANSNSNNPKERRGSKGLSGCPKSHQLPMFLSKTYHMIDKCDSSIATWSDSGDNFVVKNVEKFASNVLPLYFKHSNFSSFARQLNFYGFRKLRTDPILTSDVDPNTACYVRFYHEKFQKDRPDLLHQIKRATKSDQQSKDDLDSLKSEVFKLKECLGQLQNETDRRLAEMSYEYNRRITSMSAEYDKLASLVHQLLAAGGLSGGGGASAASQAQQAIQAQLQQQQLPNGGNASLRQNPQAAAIAAAAAVAGLQRPAASSSSNANGAAPAAPRVPDLLHSLSQAAALSLQQQAEEQRQQQQQNGSSKRSAEAADGDIDANEPATKKHQPDEY